MYEISHEFAFFIFYKMIDLSYFSRYLVGSKLLDGGVAGCRGRTIPGDAKSPGPPGLSPLVTWDKSIVHQLYSITILSLN